MRGVGNVMVTATLERVGPHSRFQKSQRLNE